MGYVMGEIKYYINILEEALSKRRYGLLAGPSQMHRRVRVPLRPLLLWEPDRTEW